MLAFIVIAMVVGGLWLIILFINGEAEVKALADQAQKKLTQVAQEQGIVDAAYTGFLIVGVNHAHKSLALYKRDDCSVLIPISMIGHVELDLERQQADTTQFQTQSKLSSQVTRGVIGGMVAGPIGAAVGGLTANQKGSSETVQTSKVVGSNLKIRLRSSEHPILSLYIKDVGAAERIAARLQNAIEEVHLCDMPESETIAVNQAIRDVLQEDRSVGPARQLSWYAKTFG